MKVTLRSQQRSLCYLALLVWLLTAVGCASLTPSSQTPGYLQQAIKDNPPKAEVTVYPIDSPEGGTVYSLAKLGGGVLLAATYKGVYRSTDNGATWRFLTVDVPVGQPRYIGDFAVLGDTVFATIGGEIYKSVDGGASWVKVAEPLPEENVSALSSAEGSLYASVSDWGVDKYSDLFRSTDLGASWQVLTADLHNLQNFDKSAARLKSADAEDLADKGVDTADKKHRIIDGTSARDTFIVNTSDGLYSKPHAGGQWRRLDDPLGGVGSRFILNSNGTLFLGPPLYDDSSTGLYFSRDAGLTWVPLKPPDGQRFVYSVVEDGGRVLAGTDRGIYAHETAAGSWNELNEGLRVWSTISFAEVGERLFVAMRENPFSRFGTTERLIYRSDDQGHAWVRANNGIPTVDDDRDSFNSGGPHTSHHIAVIGNAVFTAVNDEIFRTDDFGNYWVRAGKITPDNNSDKVEAIGDLVAFGEALLANVYYAEHTHIDQSTPSWRLYRSTDKGVTWERLNNVAGGEVSTFAKSRDLLYVASNHIYSFDGKGDWKKIAVAPTGTVTALVSLGDTLLAGVSMGDYGAHVANIYKLNTKSESKSWERLAATGLQGKLYSLWVDERDAEIIFAGTAEGLFWSKDGGVRFTKWGQEGNLPPFNEVISINRRGERFFIGTDSGIFFVLDRIQRGAWYARAYEFVSQYRWLFSGTLAVLLLLIVLSTRLISLVLQLEIPGVKNIAPWFYLTPFGRWKLYRRFRASLRNMYRVRAADKPARQDAYGAVNKYVDLPFEAGGEIPEARLSDYVIRQIATNGRVTVVSDGGRGKSTLCHFLIKTIVEGSDPASRRLQPVLVDGVAYSGNLLTAVTEALKRNHAYVNAPIAESQLAAGNLLVIFDGFSEVRESFFKDASSDIPSFVRQHPDTPFVFTSRSVLPTDLANALGNSEPIRLLDIDDGTVKSFLGSYLKRGQAGAEELLQQINIRFSSLPRIPLMLKLVATVYDTKGTVPKDTSTLFADYAEQVLRPDATGIEEPVGLHYAIRHLVRETYIRSGGDRGFSVDKGVELLERIKDRLEAYAIRLEPIKMINLLTRAGLYRRVGEHLKFFHDSFESYFAARALESDFYDGKFDLLRECVGNARLQETWGFLNEILQDEVAKKKLQELIREGAAAAAKQSYVERLLDKGVDYRIHIERDESNYRALVRTAEGEYSIKLGITQEELMRLGSELRSRMDELSRMAVHAGKKFTEGSGEHLRPLADLGYYAYGRIFSDSNLGADQEGLFAADAESTVQVVADSFFFPWEVIYPLDPTEGVSYKRFWGMNHIVSRVVIQNPAEGLNGQSAAPQPSRPYVLLFADLSLDDAREEEVPFLEQLREEGKINLSVVDTNTFTDGMSVKEIKEILGRGADIVQFSCRCSYDEHFPGNSRLMFSRSFDLRLLDFESHRIRLSGQPLVVMNTAEAGNISSTQPSGFAAVLLSRGARGVVATECKVPAATAPIFSKQLYTRLLAGKSLGASVLAARNHLWDEQGSPVGLLYSIYAPPSLKVVGVEAEAADQL